MRAFLAISVLSFSSVHAGAILDNFNRADANTLGANWTVQSGGAEITGNQAEALNGQQSPNLVTYNSYTTNSVSLDVSTNGTGLQYVGVVLGYADLNNNYFIKVQEQDGGGTFDHIGLYYGNNGGGAAPGQEFLSLTTPFASGTLTATVVGTIVTVDILPTGGTLQVYSTDYGLASGGTGIGMGLYGTALGDNFADAAGVPEPGTISMLTAGIGTLALWRKRKLLFDRILKK